LIYNGFYKQKLSRGVASDAQACFLAGEGTPLTVQTGILT